MGEGFNLAENASTAGLNSPKWLGWAAVLVWIGVIALFAAGIARSNTGWAPDRSFAGVVKIGFEAANKGTKVSEIVCLKPVLPKKTGMVVGLPQEDCLVVSSSPKGGVCFELVWENGASGTRYSCKLVRKAIRKDTQPAWVVHFATPRKFVA